MKHTTHTVHKNVRGDGFIRSTLPSVYINHIHLYHAVSVTIFPFSLGQMSFLYAMSFFTMERVNFFGNDSIQVRKCAIAVSPECLESQVQNISQNSSNFEL